ncbi:2Fe-2S iron-sulfur cluster binding domain-containing protein [Endozoicomonas sp. SM1973]|uniref:2Fe-2S iron-sulfur cluster binding domain-containing protein n=1 Tax=Spartinivicinus marinus TaxID=2994442 RepID=A0A853I440_9GAMM|nr:2Fe-2S iron-sulfur cluster-binding protein [Spartinivicinus marinus]MCX4028929.1 2Fe-2S iron-sulfur cluster-binding protein [Spartinivicinus marinus]NYZ65488.1 2Fe-2S iron-sulfur cluster binding domain-containing protein [Spartinivicinus marinus]
MKWLIVFILTLLVCSYIAWLVYREWLQFQAQYVQRGLAANNWQQRCQQVSSQLVEQSHWQGFRDFVVTRRVVENPVGDIISFYLRPRDELPLSPFSAGQHVTVRLPIGSRVYTRCYSLSESYNPDYYRISVKRADAPAKTNHPAGKVSSYLHEEVYEGAIVEIREPQGSFVLPESTIEPLVFLVAGVGYTPVLSMLKVLVNQPFPPPVVVFYCVRNGSHHAAKDEFEALQTQYQGLHLYVSYSHPRSALDWPEIDYQLSGRLNGQTCLDVLAEISLQPQQCQYYFCGPEAFMTKLQQELAASDIDTSQFHDECFSATVTHQVPLLDAPELSEVVFSSSGRRSEWLQGEDRWLLTLSEEEGVSINSSCRKGSCGSCMTEILEGEVGYLKDPEFLNQKQANHFDTSRYCLPCVCYPKSNRLVLNV